MRQAVLVCAVVVALALGATARADPIRHFDTFRIDCGGHVYVITSKPGSSTVVTVDGEPSTQVSVLMGITVTVNGVVQFEFHKPYTEQQDVTVCVELDDPPGTVIVAETLITPRRP